MKTLVVCSGGLDSVTLAHHVAAHANLCGLLSFDYGQRHLKELDYARACARRLGVAHRRVDLTDVGRHLTGSALTDDIPVPDGHYAEETMKLTVVPNRNAIMLAVAFGAAAASGAEAVALAVHGGDHFIYPDCRPDFIAAFTHMQTLALDGIADIALQAPFLNRDKTAIAVAAGRLGVPIDATWSCYKGGAIHCGRCGTCVERREALHAAGVPDPTDYADPDYWQSALARAAGR